jgi:hypothetical protein
MSPAALDASRVNLKNPPRIYTEIALEQLPGDISFFKNDVPDAFKEAKDAKLRAEFAKSNATVIAALEKYEEWLKSDLLPVSNGDFRIGADTFSKKLLYDEMVDTPLDKLLGRYANLHRNRDNFAGSRRKSMPKKPQTRCSRNWREPPPRIICRVSATPLTVSPGSFAATTSSPFPPTSAPLLKKRRPSCARPRSPPWTRQVLSKSTRPKRIST